MKLGIAVPRWFKALRCPAPVLRNDAGWRGDDSRTGDMAPCQAVAKNGDTRETTNALVGGVRGLEGRRGRSDEEMGVDVRRSCSRGATGWQKLSGMV